MKNFYSNLVLIFVVIVQPIYSFSQSDSQLSFSLESGITYGDANYGNEFAFEYLQNEDYTSIGASNDAGYGLDLSIGLLYQMDKKNEVNITAGLLNLGTEVFGNITGLRSTVMRPLSSDIPTQVDGRINYALLDFGASFIHNFNGINSNGFMISAGVNYWFNLNPTWNVDVDFEAGNTGNQNNLSDVADTKLNNVIATNLRLGYNIIVNEKYRITPSLGFDLGLNEFSEDRSLSPSFFSFNIRFNPIK